MSAAEEREMIQALRTDLAGVDRPNWKLSCFARAKGVEGNDISNTDVSPEELRELYYRERRSGNLQNYVSCCLIENIEAGHRR